MGYRTVLRVPRVRTYAEAKKILTTTKPIRGTTTIPLGDRRDHHQYSIRIQGNQDIELVCYRTPAVTFHPDDSITIRNGGWSSVSTHQFIQQITGIPANGRGMYSVLSLKDSKVAISGNETASFVRRDGNWHCVSSHIHPSFRINRKAANNVRAKYRDFMNYIKGFAKLRGEFVEGVYGRDGYMAINFSYDELKAVLKEDADGDLIWQGTNDLLYRPSDAHMRRGEEMIGWVTSGDHEQYLKAAIDLYAQERTQYVKDPNAKINPNFYRPPLRRHASLGPKNFDAFILRWHAEEVIEECETKPNAVPNTRYKEWLATKRGG
jgi:hypothetical protein